MQVLGLPQPAEPDAVAAGSDGEGPATAAAARRRGPGSRKGRPPLYSYFVKVKKQHPKAVALVRVGAWCDAAVGHVLPGRCIAGSRRGAPSGRACSLCMHSVAWPHF